MKNHENQIVTQGNNSCKTNVRQADIVLVVWLIKKIVIPLPIVI